MEDRYELNISKHSFKVESSYLPTIGSFEFIKLDTILSLTGRGGIADSSSSLLTCLLIPNQIVGSMSLEPSFSRTSSSDNSSSSSNDSLNSFI